MDRLQDLDSRELYSNFQDYQKELLFKLNTLTNSGEIELIKRQISLNYFRHGNPVIFLHTKELFEKNCSYIGTEYSEVSNEEFRKLDSNYISILEKHFEVIINDIEDEIEEKKKLEEENNQPDFDF